MSLFFRSTRRNRTFDLARISAVKSATSAALTSVKSESMSLRERMNELRFSLATTIGDEAGIYFDREPQAEAELVFLEQQYLEAEQRSAMLDKQIQILTEVDRLLRDLPCCDPKI